MKRKTHKHNKNKIKRYTAAIPKTLKATKAVGMSIVNKINYFITKTGRTIKNTTKMLDKSTAKSIRSLTKRRPRK